MQRRDLLRLFTFASAYQTLRATAAALPEAPTNAFDYAWLKGQARALAAQAYDDHVAPLPSAVRDLDYARYQQIHFLPEHSLWHAQGRGLELRFFHAGFIFKRAVRLFEVVDGQAQRLAYDPGSFDLSKSGLDPQSLNADLGYAGFRIVDTTNPDIDVAAFLGASYFRAVGADKQYGLSARGLP